MPFGETYIDPREPKPASAALIPAICKARLSAQLVTSTPDFSDDPEKAAAHRRLQAEMIDFVTQAESVRDPDPQALAFLTIGMLAHDLKLEHSIAERYVDRAQSVDWRSHRVDHMIDRARAAHGL